MHFLPRQIMVEEIRRQIPKRSTTRRAQQADDEAAFSSCRRRPVHKTREDTRETKVLSQIPKVMHLCETKAPWFG